MLDHSLALMTGVDIPMPEIQTVVHQPTIKDISYIGEKEYFLALQLFCFNRDTILASIKQGKDVLQSMNDFQIFMTLMNESSAEDRKTQILNLLTIFFPSYTATFIPSGIYCNDASTKHNFVIDENTFEALRKILSDVGGLNSITGGENSGFNPKGEKAAEIAAKLMRGRQRAARAKGEGQSTGGVLSRYVSILVVGLESMSLDNCLNLTVYQLYDLMERYGLYTAWDIDIRSRLAGGKPDSKPDDWMKSIH